MHRQCEEFVTVFLILVFHMPAEQFQAFFHANRASDHGVPRLSHPQFKVNGHLYQIPPAHSPPIVAILLDGNSQEYIDAASSASCMPNWTKLLSSGVGTHGLVTGAMPSFTNPNNVSVVTGVTPKTHGICGNYFLDAGMYAAASRNVQLGHSNSACSA